MPLAEKWTEALNVAGLCYPGNFGEHKRLLAVLEAFICKTQMPSYCVRVWPPLGVK